MKKPYKAIQILKICVKHLVYHVRPVIKFSIAIRNMVKKGYIMPCIKTVNRILKRYGRITIEESLKRKKFIRFEHEHPNDLWQMDFKGHFRLTNKIRCHPLTLLDDCTRYSLGIIACGDERLETVKQALIDIFRKWGLPKRMTMDNGAPWGYSGSQNYTQLTVWLIQQTIYVSHSRPYHPQTQGKLERFHRTFKQEFLNRYYFDTLAQAQKGFDWWRDFYNDERPHSAIEAYSPSEIYHRSERSYCEKIQPYEYTTEMDVRKVNQKGIMSYKGRRYFVGEAFGGQAMGLMPSNENDIVNVYFCHQKVFKLDLNQPLNY
ncbi:transposase [Coxiella burnetii]|nr:transposase [Coxiella burnetii]PNT81256.1 transposase [Coxiella burnetii]PNT82227.1 transposase [Coxiella burnetii]PNT85147.1 transposase [Coxiella burnetii]PNT88983.1 transposase [Coxiella burnetii]